MILEMFHIIRGERLWCFILHYAGLLFSTSRNESFETVVYFGAFEGYVSTREPTTVRFRNDASGVSIYKENVQKWPKFRNFDQLTKFRMSHVYVTGYWESSYFFRM